MSQANMHGVNEEANWNNKDARLVTNVAALFVFCPKAN